MSRAQGRNALRRPITAFLDEAHEAVGMSQLGRAFFALASSFGYDNILVFDTGKLGGSMRKALIYAGQAEGRGRSELIAFADQAAFASHPVVTEALANDGPFLADDVRKKLHISEEQWAATIPPQVRRGPSLILPVHREGRCVLIAACHGADADIGHTARAALHASVHAFYDRSAELWTARPQHAELSHREAECMHWFGLGKTGVEIAAITGISARTVRYHLHNAREKLGANSALDAVRKLSASARGRR